MSGAGKTNLTFQILRQLRERKKPFLVFDWKKNYRDLSQLPEFKWMKMDRQEAARQELEQVLRKAPDHSGAIHNLAKVYGRLGMEGERQDLLTRHRELDSLSRDRFERDTRILYHMNSGITHFNENRFQEAIGEFSAGVDLDPRNARVSPSNQ